MENSMILYTLRINRHLFKKFSSIAKYNGRTKNQELCQMVKASIRNFEAVHGPIKPNSFPNNDLCNIPPINVRPKEKYL